MQLSQTGPNFSTLQNSISLKNDVYPPVTCVQPLDLGSHPNPTKNIFSGCYSVNQDCLPELTVYCSWIWACFKVRSVTHVVKQIKVILWRRQSVILALLFRGGADILKLSRMPAAQKLWMLCLLNLTLLSTLKSCCGISCLPLLPRQHTVEVCIVLVWGLNYPDVGDLHGTITGMLHHLLLAGLKASLSRPGGAV